MPTEGVRNSIEGGGPGMSPGIFFWGGFRWLPVIYEGTFQAMKQLIFHQQNTDKYLWKLFLKFVLINYFLIDNLLLLSSEWIIFSSGGKVCHDRSETLFF